MRGYPPLQLLLVVIGFGLLSLPLYHLTCRPQAMREKITVSEQEAEKPRERKATLQVRCAHAPESLELLTAKGSLVTWKQETQWPQNTNFSYTPGKAVEIAISAAWAKSIPSTAVSLEFIPEGYPAQSKTLWSQDAEMDDVFQFTSPAQP